MRPTVFYRNIVLSFFNLHSFLYFFRDLKPSNIFMADNLSISIGKQRSSLHFISRSSRYFFFLAIHRNAPFKSFLLQFHGVVFKWCSLIDRIVTFFYLRTPSQCICK